MTDGGKNQEMPRTSRPVTEKRRKYIPSLFAAVAIVLGIGHLFRSMWFDEAITIMDFVMPLDPLKIYFSYNIPNNHIIYSELLRLWMYGAEAAELIAVPMFRIPSLIIASVGAYFLCRFMLGRCGLMPCLLCSLALFASPCFMIYSTAVRGYMPGFALTVAAFITAYKIMRGGSFAKYSIIYFAICLLSVGTTPTNIAALAAVAIFFVPDVLKGKNRLAKASLLILAPPLSLLVFYLPIWEKFIACAKLGEGWHSETGAVWNLYGSFALIFLPVIPFCIYGAAWLYKKHPEIRLRLIAGLLIFLLPLPAFFLFKAPPFPRVFFPLFAVWTILLAYSLAGYFGRFPGRKIANIVPFILLGAWLPFCGNFSGKISDTLFGKGGRTDDLTAPYYARPEFNPGKLLMFIQEQTTDGEDVRVFASFNADYPSVLFASLFSNFPENTILADFPKQKATDFAELSGQKYVICENAAEFESIRSRFKLPSGTLVLSSGIQRLYRISE